MEAIQQRWGRFSAPWKFRQGQQDGIFHEEGRRGELSGVELLGPAITRVPFCIDPCAPHDVQSLPSGQSRSAVRPPIYQPALA